MKHFSFGLLSASVIAFSAPVAAMDMNGTATGTSNVGMMPVGESGAMVTLDTQYDIYDLDSDDHPMQGASGPCNGSFVMMDGAVSGGGHCLLEDASGDLNVVRFDVEDRAEDGTLTGMWSVMGGTGKWKGATGEGRFESMTDQGSGQTTNMFTGEIAMAE